MKKFLAIFAIAGALVACNNETETETTTEDTTTVVTPVDTMTAPVNVDTTVVGDTTTTPAQ